MSAPSRLQRDAGRRMAGQDSRRYLLFAGTQQPPNGGLCDLVDTFTSEQAARQAFCDIRLGTASTASWAQLAVVDGHAGITPLCWFGIGAEPRRGGPTIDRPPVHLNVIAADRTHRPKRIRVLVTALVAGATTMIAVLVDSDRRPSPARPHPAVSVPVEVSR